MTAYEMRISDWSQDVCFSVLLHARLQQQLRRDMPLLVVLRDLQRIVVAGEIGAGILPVGIEKKAEQLVREVVMVRHLLLRPSDGVVVLDVGDSIGIASSSERVC